MLRTLWLVVCVILLLGRGGLAGEPPGMEIFFIDVEGGAATLIVGPARQSLLVDCGNPGTRDAQRIAKVAKTVAGLERIDHCAITHWHADHYGGIGHLATLLPIGRFYDRGIPDSLQEDPQYFPFLIANYRKAADRHRTTLAPGDRISLDDGDGPQRLEVLCLTSARQVLEANADAESNPHCDGSQPRKADPSDNAMSLSLLIRYGSFTFLDCGDLTWNVEFDLVCPRDPIGKVDVFQVTHHGLDSSNNPVLLNTVQPVVAIYNNGSRKGAMPRVTRMLRNLPDLQAVYQLHRNLNVGDDLNTQPAFIANHSADCDGEFIHLQVARDSKTYTVRIGADGAPRTYRTRTAAH